MNTEKQEIKEIVNEIDITMFGARHKKSGFETFIDVAPISALGMLFGGLSTFITSPDNTVLFASLGTIAGGLFGYYISKDTKNSIYKDYEFAYLSLSRDKQIEVLKLSKRLFELYEQVRTKEKNKKYINKYLQINQEKTMFDEFESNHPQFKLLTEDEIKDIHNRGKLTPTEKFYEWRKLNYCPFAGNLDFKCENYETCRDCTVDLVNQIKEWDKMNTVPIKLIDPYNEAYKQMWWKENKDVVKQKTKKA